MCMSTLSSGQSCSFMAATMRGAAWLKSSQDRFSSFVTTVFGSLRAAAGIQEWRPSAAGSMIRASESVDAGDLNASSRPLLVK